MALMLFSQEKKCFSSLGLKNLDGSLIVISVVIEIPPRPPNQSGWMSQAQDKGAG
jgi:hypothetical protein